MPTLAAIPHLSSPSFTPPGLLCPRVPLTWEGPIPLDPRYPLLARQLRFRVLQTAVPFSAKKHSLTLDQRGWQPPPDLQKREECQARRETQGLLPRTVRLH